MFSVNVLPLFMNNYNVCRFPRYHVHNPFPLQEAWHTFRDKEGHYMEEKVNKTKDMTEIHVPNSVHVIYDYVNVSFDYTSVSSFAVHDSIMWLKLYCLPLKFHFCVNSVKQYSSSIFSNICYFVYGLFTDVQ